MKLAYVVHVKSPGNIGGEIRSYQVASAMAHIGLHLQLIGNIDKNYDWDENIVPIPLIKPFFLALWQLLYLFWRNKINVIIERYQFPFFNVGALTQILRSKPFILEIHGFPIDEFIINRSRPDTALIFRILSYVPKSILERYQAFLFMRATHFIVTSSGTRNILTEKYNVDPRKISVIYNGVNPKMFDSRRVDSEQEKMRIGFGVNSQVILYAGSLFHEELEIVINALIDILKNSSNIIFLCIGSGSFSHLEKILVSGEVDDTKFAFRESVAHNEMVNLLSAVDVVVAPYSLSSTRFKQHFHYSPLKIMEALSMEKSIVTVNASELVKEFGDLSNVYFAESGSVTSWKGMISRSLELHEQVDVSQGREHVINSYNWEQIARQYREIIEECHS